MTTITINLADCVRPEDRTRCVQYAADGSEYCPRRQRVESPLYRAVEACVRPDVTISVDWSLRRITLYPTGRFEPHHAVFAVASDHPVWESQRKWRQGRPWDFEGTVEFEVCESYLTRPIDGAPPVIRPEVVHAL